MGSGSKVYAYSGLTFDLSNARTFAKKKKKKMSERASLLIQPGQLRWLVLDLMVDVLLDFRAIAFFSLISLLTIPFCIDSSVGLVRLPPRIDRTNG